MKSTCHYILIKITREVALDRTIWYRRNRTGRPSYLEGRDYKIMARLRCGAEARGEDVWWTEQGCRVCGEEKETAAHLVKCSEIEELYNPDGGAAGLAKLYLAKRVTQ